jgi:hypothetical protein
VNQDYSTNFWLPGNGGIRKRVLCSVVLVGLLCTAGFAQIVQTSGEAPFELVGSSHNAVRWNAGLMGNFESAWKGLDEPMAIEGRAKSCISATAFLLDSVAVGRDAQHPRVVPIWRMPGSPAFFFVSRMAIDADGAPNAYNSADTGLDALANAGEPSRWNGIITDRHGNPVIQKDDDPFPGYYISCTSLSDETKEFTDPTSYVNASQIPYVVLPKEVADRGGARLGDFALVMNLRNGKSSFAIYADIGTLGEGSVALADALGIWSDARRGGQSGGILYLLFPESGNLRPRSITEIQSEGEKLLHHWGGVKSLSACIESDPYGNIGF